MEDKKDIVKYRNEFNLTNLNALDKIEMDILFTICSKITKNKSMAAEISFEELKEKAFLTEKRYVWESAIKKFTSLADKILSIKFVIDKQQSFEMMTLFNRFTANKKEEKMTVSLNPCFAHYLFDIPEKIGFSRFELEQFIFLKSKYSKTLFRLFLENYTGKWVIDFQKFKEILDFPTSYSNGRILEYIKNILPELENTGYFSDIEMDYTTRSRQGRPIKDVVFTYKINKEKALEAQGQTTLDYEPVTEKKTIIEDEIIQHDDGLPHIQSTEKVIETDKKCPYCGSQVISRTVTGDTPNKGRRYEKCEKNDLKLGDEKCCYFQWLD